MSQTSLGVRVRRALFAMGMMLLRPNAGVRICIKRLGDERSKPKGPSRRILA